VTAYVDELAAAGSAILGDALVGVYPHGSLVLGGWNPSRSDVDVLVVVSRSLTPADKTALAAAWSEEALPSPGVGLELSVVLASVAASPNARPAFELHVTTAPEDAKVVDGTGHPGDLDLVLHFAICHALGYPGFAEVPPDLVLAQVVDELSWALEHASPTYAVLNACRAWRYAAEGSLVSKVDGGQWALERVSTFERPVVESALALQTGDETAVVDPTSARALVLRLQDVIRIEP
jgi:streptomycin 3"-adenylyltransferase